MRVWSMWVGLMLAVSVVGAALATEAAPEKKRFSEKQLAQQQRMTDCSADAKEKGLKGHDQRAFMKTCLSGGSVTATVDGQSASAPAEPPGGGNRK